jgi:hypothetical protein
LDILYAKVFDERGEKALDAVSSLSSACGVFLWRNYLVGLDGAPATSVGHDLMIKVSL